jgi:hypothetical protein
MSKHKFNYTILVLQLKLNTISLWATLGDQYVSYGYTLKNTDGFVKDIQYMLSSLKTPANYYYQSYYELSTNVKMESVKSNSMASLLYGLGEAIYNNITHLKEKDIMKGVDIASIEKELQSYSYFPAKLSWKFNKTNCEMMMEGKWTELFDLWNDYYWQTYSKRSLTINTGGTTHRSSSTTHRSSSTTYRSSSTTYRSTSSGNNSTPKTRTQQPAPIADSGHALIPLFFTTSALALLFIVQ